MKIEVVRETHEAPKYVQELLRHAGGLNRFGEPNYRLVWGWSRLSWIGGKWLDYDRNGNFVREAIELRHVPKYLPFDRWHLERWAPPEKYGSPRSWYHETMETCDGLRIPALGPYPARGEYELSLTLEEPCRRCPGCIAFFRRKTEKLECKDLQFVQISSEIAHRLARSIEFSRTITEEERRAALDRRQERDARDEERAEEEILNDDPAPMSRERREYIERVVQPQLDRALARAMKRKEQQPAKPSYYKASVGPRL